jgi:serine/threonine-protein kinase RsbW
MLETPRILNIPSQPNSITIVERMIDDICEQYAVKEDFYGNILISLTEAVNNAIVHGNKLDPSKQVSVTFDTRGTFLRFKVEDEGPGFDYENLPDPTAPENIEKPNGRGVFLMRHLADNCAFLDDGRIVEIEFNAIPS